MRNAAGSVEMAGWRNAANRHGSTTLLLSMLLLMGLSGTALAGTVMGKLETPGGIPVSNGVLSFRLRQAGLEIGAGIIVPLTTDCFTSTDGSVVGLPNPQVGVVSSAQYGAGTLPAGIYYVRTTFYSSAQETLPSPEARVQLTGAGTLMVSPPASWPSNATGMRVYIGSTPGGEQLQGQTTNASQTFSQTVPLNPGTAPPAANSSTCTIAFNDTIIPYSGYDVSLLSSSGAAYPGWPQAWQLNGGPSGVVDVSQGAPLWNGVVIYPQPIVAQPLNHGPQSIAGSLNLGGYDIVDTGAIGVGTTTPSWPVDVEDGAINANGGYLVNGSGGDVGQCLVSNGTAFLPGACFTPGSTFYQRLGVGGETEPQEPAANFSSSFVMADSPGSSTNIDLAPSGVTAGAYSNPSITINAKGQITQASSGPAVPTIQAARLTTGICTTGPNSYDTCEATVNWPTAFADANYTVTCLGIGPNDPRAALVGAANGRTPTSVQVTIATEGSVAVTYSEIDCIGVHP